MNIYFSINIPTYNQSDYIIACISSVLSQDHPYFEINIGDDSNNDLTKELIDENFEDKRIRYFKNEPRLGRVANYKKLLFEHTRHPWAVNLDGDDYWIDNTYLSIVSELIKSNEKIVLACAKHKAMREDGTTYHKSTAFHQTAKDVCIIDGFDDFVMNLEGIRSGHLTSIYNVKLAKEINIYNHDILTADSESILRIALYGKVAFINKYVAIWREHDVNASRKSSIAEFVEAFLRNGLVYEEAIKNGLPLKKIKYWKSEMDVKHANRVLGRILYEKQFHDLDLLKSGIRKFKVPVSKLFFSFEYWYKLVRIAIQRPFSTSQFIFGLLFK